jgi:hypothetical protein
MTVVLIVIVILATLFKKQEPPVITNVVFSLGKPYAIHTGLPNTPDTNTTFAVVKDIPSLVFSADVRGYVAPVTNLSPLVLGRPKILIEPGLMRKDGAYQGYLAPASVVPTKSGPCYLLHEEYWKTKTNAFPFTAQIDVWCGGLSTAPVTILTGVSNTQFATENRVTGVGQPCSVVIDDNVYLYFTDWDAGYDTIHVARAPLSDFTNPTAWKKYKDGSFSSPGLLGASDPVVTPQFEDDDYAASCNVTWNNYLGQYVMLYETRIGVYLVRSSDGITWSAPLPVLKFSSFPGKKVGYASLISAKTAIGQTSAEGIIVLSIRDVNSAETMYGIPFTFS